MTASSATTTRAELIGRLNQAMREASGMGVLFSHAMAERLGINSTDLECLDLVLLRGPLTAGALAQLAGLTTGAITGVVDRLERAGLARRERDPGDRRKVMVVGAPDVEARVAPFSGPMERAMIAALGHYSDAELALLLDFFERAKAGWDAAMAELAATANA